MKSGRPVKIALTREEVFYCHRGRHPVLMHSRLGVKKDGAITGLHFQTILDGYHAVQRRDQSIPLCLRPERLAPVRDQEGLTSKVDDLDGMQTGSGLF